MRYYCHHCHIQINSDELLPDYTCPSCHSGFIEEIPAHSSRRNSSVDESNRSGSDDGNPGALNSTRMSSDEYSDDNSDVEFLEAVTGPIAQALGFLQPPPPQQVVSSLAHPTPNTTTLTTTATIPNTTAGQSSQQESGTNINNNPANPYPQRTMVTRSVNRGLGRSTPGQIQHTTTYLDASANSTLADVLNDFITGVSFGTHYPPDEASSSSQNVQGASVGGPIPANRGLINIDFPLPFYLHSNPGDYAWGNAGFDAVITQLLNNLDGSNSGPPPMPKDQVDNLPTVKISDDQVKNSNLQCTVCMDDFQVGDEARQLPCEHFFHQACILPWLNLHASCPICRKTFTNGNIVTTQNQSSEAVSEATNNSSTTVNSNSSRLSNRGLNVVGEPINSTRNPTSSSTVANVTPNYDYTEDDCD